ncbi:hypothetical protein VTJ83DRAFT_3385 [Remersonia thermophila]|uniref:Nicotinamide N-methyltransferase n=1 Tax=Remersonia thermophila TaxID=72144 RepID=A0ABR4DDZ9_9PEZI
MALVSRLSLTGPAADEPEDLLASSLGVIFPDDVSNQHGDSEHGLLYTSPHLPKPLAFALANVSAERDRYLFSHYLWNAALLLAELVEAGTLGLPAGGKPGEEGALPWDETVAPQEGPGGLFDVTGLSTIELGAGTALPSVMAALLGAKRVAATDYPTPPVIATLKNNVQALVTEEHAVPGRFRISAEAGGEVRVVGHEWGKLPGGEAGEGDDNGDDEDAAFTLSNKHAFDRVIACDCLWMPWQHENLRRSIAWFLRDDDEDKARAWVVAGFHTGRQKMAPFFDAAELAKVGLEVEYLWERDCDGTDREWVRDRGIEDVSMRKRWLAVGVLRRIRKRGDESGDGKL